MSDTPEKEWWEPIIKGENLNWLCDHVGDFQEKADRLWEEYTKLKAENARLRLELEDKQFCKEGLWYCEVGEKLAREQEWSDRNWESLVQRAEKAEREVAKLLADAERLDLMQRTESYPFKDYKCWKFIVGKQIVEGATVRECLDAALAALKGSP